MFPINSIRIVIITCSNKWKMLFVSIGGGAEVVAVVVIIGTVTVQFFSRSFNFCYGIIVSMIVMIRTISLGTVSSKCTTKEANQQQRPSATPHKKMYHYLWACGRRAFCVNFANKCCLMNVIRLWISGNANKLLHIPEASEEQKPSTPILL